MTRKYQQLHFNLHHFSGCYISFQ